MKLASDNCLTCDHHGPPVSDAAGDRPCADCVPYAGFPKWTPVRQNFLTAHPPQANELDEFLEELTAAACRDMGIPRRYYDGK